MSIREGRGRPRRDYPSRSEEKSHHGRGNYPPSRHLWIGNLPNSLTESVLAHHLLQFGELDSVAFHPGRSYAFVNYRNDEDAFAAIKELQGFVLGGNSIKIEFTKAEKSAPPRDADYSERRDEPPRRDDLYPKERGRDSRARRSSPELSHSNKSRMNDRDSEPSEVLWVGFPAQLKVDEFILRKAFSQFGEIEKITAFPGRTYAFVRFRNVVASCRAKEALHGKLFGNPRVHICFAKSESGTSNRERNSMDDPSSPHGVSYGRAGSYEHLRSDRDFGGGMSRDQSVRSPPFIPNLDHGDPNMMGLARNANLWRGGNDADEQRRYPRQGSELGLRGNVYEHPNSPSRNIDARFRDFPTHNIPRQGPIYDDDPWDLPEDVSYFHETKKLKTDTFPPENELPEYYPLSDLEKAKRILPQEIPQSGLRDKNYDPRHSGYRQIPEHLSTSQPFEERGDRWNNTPLDDFRAGLLPLPPPPDRRKLIHDLRESSSKEVWKWEGMIAKGGSAVCRARCFPVGKPPDMVLPEYLDCTARTSLDMLAKHYYQAASAWVVFFVPANDPDISYYNEFMNYLGEKQRAAVVKVDDRTTLFLVPPSEFSEKVLKVPGKLSISGVVLRLDPPGSSHGSHPQYENRETPFASFQGDLPHQRPISPSVPYLPAPAPFNNYEKPGINAGPHSISNMQPANAQGHDYMQKPIPGQNWPPQDMQNSSSNRKITSQPYNPFMASTGHSYPPIPQPILESSHSNYIPEKYPIPSSVPGAAGIPAEQLAQLTSSLLGQQGQSSVGEYIPSGNVDNNNQPGNPFRMPQSYGNDQVSSEFPQGQFGQMQQSPNLVASEREAQNQGSQQFQNAGQQDGDEADPQKRLQATLQLAAALLQQIQQGKGT